MKESGSDAWAVREMWPEYRFDYGQSRPNRLAGEVGPGATLVVLDPDVAQVLKTSASVNDFLGSVIGALPRTGTHNERPGTSLAE